MSTSSIIGAALPPGTKRPAPRILQPFDRREATTLKGFAHTAGISIATARETVHVQLLGRKVGGRWLVSRVAAAAYLDGNREALKAYWAGDRTSDLVRPYFERLGLDPASLGREG